MLTNNCKESLWFLNFSLVPWSPKPKKVNYHNFARTHRYIFATTTDHCHHNTWYVINIIASQLRCSVNEIRWMKWIRAFVAIINTWLSACCDGRDLPAPHVGSEVRAARAPPTPCTVTHRLIFILTRDYCINARALFTHADGPKKQNELFILYARCRLRIRLYKNLCRDEQMFGIYKYGLVLSSRTTV